jgi:hypothetical protein
MVTVIKAHQNEKTRANKQRNMICGDTQYA